MAPQKELLLKLTSMRHKKAGTSEQQLHDFATKVHAPKAAVIQARHGLVKVIQYHTPSATRDMLKAFPNIPPGWSFDDHDLHICFYVKSLEQLGALMGDAEFQAMIAEEVYIVEAGTANLTLGWEEVYVDDGKVVNVVEGESAWPGFATSVETLTGSKPAA